MPVTGAGGRRRWLSARACRLHAAVLVAVPLCLLAGWWQATRALDGNALSYAYAVEWPFFAGLAAWTWWQLLHTDPPADPAPADRAPKLGPALSPQRGPGAGARPAPHPAPSWDRAAEPPELQAYNRYLQDLQAGRRPRRPRARPTHLGRLLGRPTVAGSGR